MRQTAALLLLLTCARSGSAARSPGPALERIRLDVKDLPAALSWLDKVLGWKPSYRDERRALVGAGAVRLELDAAPSDSSATLALAGVDADADYRRLLERGAVSIEAPMDRPTGFREAYLRGPGALTVELDGPLAEPSGFAFTEVAPGTGETPKPTDTVSVHYVGTLRDGTVFDGAHRKGRPALIPLADAVRCWTTALTRMKAGGRAKFVCPPELAYGKRGHPPRIPPNATLTYDVELVGVAP